MMRASYAELERVGLGYIKMWGCEQSGSNADQLDWITYMEEHCGDILDCHTDHRYVLSHTVADKYFADLKRLQTIHPLCLPSAVRATIPEIFRGI